MAMCVGTSALQLLFRFFAVIFVALRQITLSLRNQAAGNFVWSKEIARLPAACSLLLSISSSSFSAIIFLFLLPYYAFSCHDLAP